jgi:hypothetical protein
MREEVRVWARAKERKQGEAGRRDHPPLTRGLAPSAGHDSRSREDSDGTEHCRRGADRVVMEAVDDGRESVAAGAGEKKQPEADPWAELVAHRPDKQAARRRVAEHMRRVGVERERGDGSPPLSGDNAFGDGTATLEPDAVACTRTSGGKEPDQQEANGYADRGRATNGRRGIDAHVRGADNVLPIKGVESLAGGLHVTGGDDERPAIQPEAQPIRDVAGRQHHGPFVGPVALRRHADGSSSEIVHLLAMIDVADMRAMIEVDTEQPRVLCMLLTDNQEFAEPKGLR